MNTWLKLFVFALSTGWCLSAAAVDQVVRCDNCASAVNAAVATGTNGLKVIADPRKKTVVAYEIEYDRELRRWRTFQKTVPAGMKESFSAIMSASSATVVVRVGTPGQLINSNSAFSDSNAHEIIQSATLRSGLARELAANFAKANTSSDVWDDLAYSLTSVGITALGQIAGINNFNFVLQFPDGSSITMKIDSNTVTQATYVAGKSTDADGNRIADSAASGPGGGEYAGGYYFSTNQNLQDWLNTAIMNGVKVTGPSSNNRRLSCSWDGRTLSCRYM